MNTKREIPISLKVVAWLFIIGGLLAVIEVIVSLMHGRIFINFGVLGLFIGPGLLCLRPGWRICALVFIWIGLILTPIFTILMLLTANQPLDFNVFGQKVGHIGKIPAFIMAVLMFALVFWQYRVLTRDDVRRLFGIGITEREEFNETESV